MVNFVYIELFKLKRSKMLWLIVLAIVLPIITTAIQLSNAPAGYIIKWRAYMFWTEISLNSALAPFLFALLTGFIITREYQQHTASNLFTYPYSRVELALGKILAMLPIIIITFTMFLILTLTTGLFLCKDTLTLNLLWDHLKINFCLIIFHFGLIPFTALVSSIGRNIVPSVIVGIIGAFTHIQGVGIVLPWTFPFTFLEWLYNSSEMNIYQYWTIPNIYLNTFILTTTFVVTFVIYLFYQRQSELDNR